MLRQIQQTPKVRYSLTPNQHVGAWEVSFMPGWIAREYLGRRGIAKFPANRLQAARCPLLGYTLCTMQVEGTVIPTWFLRVDEQPEVGPDGYDKGAAVLNDFFVDELRKFVQPGLDKLGKQIIDCCISGGSVADYESLLPSVDVTPQ